MSGARLVAFAGAAVGVEWTHPRGAEIVDHLYGRIPLVDGPAPAAVFRIDAEGAAAEFVVTEDGVLHYRGPLAGMAALVVLDHSIHRLAEQIGGGLLLHAGALAAGGKAIVIPGESGAGKTTLTAWLAAEGLEYLTDELVFLPADDLRLEAFRRPLNIKRPARQALEGIVAFDGSQPIIETPEGYLVSPPSISAPAARGSMLLFPEYHAGAALEIAAVSPARAAMRLLQCLVNARRLPQGGLTQTTEVARRLPAYALRYGDFAQLGNAIQDLLARA